MDKNKTTGMFNKCVRNVYQSKFYDAHHQVEEVGGDKEGDNNPSVIFHKTNEWIGKDEDLLSERVIMKH